MSDLMGGGVYTDMWMCVYGKGAFELGLAFNFMLLIFI